MPYENMMNSINTPGYSGHGAMPADNPIDMDGAMRPDDPKWEEQDKKHGRKEDHKEAHKSHKENHENRRSMSKRDILTCFANHDMKDELEVAEKYLDYSIALEAGGHHELAQRVAEMAYEEVTHAKFQRMVLERSGYPVEGESAQKYHEVIERVRSMFQNR